MPRIPSERTATGDHPVVGIDALADADADAPGALAQGSDVHDVDDLERQLGAAPPSLDALLRAYLNDDDDDPMPSVPAVEVVDPRRGNPRRRG